MASLIPAAESLPATPRWWLAIIGPLLTSPKALIGILVQLLVVFAAVFAPQLAPLDPNIQDLSARLLSPFSTAARSGGGAIHGPAPCGRGIVRRPMYGCRAWRVGGQSTAFVAGVIGVTLGLLAGFLGRWVDAVIMRFCDVQLALPYILIALALLTIFRGSLMTVVMVLAFTQWVTYARVVRASALAEREKDYIEAARALGMRPGRIMWRYMLPNLMAPVIVIATFSMAQAIISEASLSFLGLGVPASIPSLGGMLADGRTYLAMAWWIATLPGIAITILAISINLLGDWLRDHLDPKLRA
jgi:peptide/nickel transport system permease protein